MALDPNFLRAHLHEILAHIHKSKAIPRDVLLEAAYDDEIEIFISVGPRRKPRRTHTQMENPPVNAESSMKLDSLDYQILHAIGNETLAAKQIALQIRRRNTGTFRTRLSRMMKQGLLTHQANGYSLTESGQKLTSQRHCLHPDSMSDKITST